MDKAPDAFRTISEVAQELDIPQHVLRFWETRFSQIKPMKRSGGRRYYRGEDVRLLSNIKDLLYNQGLTIRGVQKLLKETGHKGIVRPSAQTASAQEAATNAMAALIATQASATSLSVTTRHELESLLTDLKTMRETLRAVGL